MHVTGTNHPLDEDVERELTRIGARSGGERGAAWRS